MHIKLLRSSEIGKNESCSPPCQPDILSISLACRPNKTKCENISNRGRYVVTSVIGVDVLQGFTCQPILQKRQYSPSKVPTKFGSKGFEITDSSILVNDPEVTE